MTECAIAWDLGKKSHKLVPRGTRFSTGNGLGTPFLTAFQSCCALKTCRKHCQRCAEPAHETELACVKFSFQTGASYATQVFLQSSLMEGLLRAFVQIYNWIRRQTMNRFKPYVSCYLGYNTILKHRVFKALGYTQSKRMIFIHQASRCLEDTVLPNRLEQSRRSAHVRWVILLVGSRFFGRGLKKTVDGNVFGVRGDSPEEQELSRGPSTRSVRETMKMWHYKLGK